MEEGLNRVDGIGGGGLKNDRERFTRLPHLRE